MEECLKEKQLKERTDEKEPMNEEQMKEELGRCLNLKLIKCLVSNRIQARLCSSHEKYQDQHKRTKKRKAFHTRSQQPCPMKFARSTGNDPVLEYEVHAKVMTFRKKLRIADCLSGP